MRLTFRFYHPRTFQLLKEEEDLSSDVTDAYVIGEIYARHLKYYIENNEAVIMSAESEYARHRFRVIRKTAGALVIEEA